MNNFKQDGDESTFQLVQKIAQLEDCIFALNNQLEEYKNLEHIQQSEAIFVYTEGIKRRIAISDILLIKSESNYSIIHTLSGDKLLTSKTLKFWQETIKNTEIIRVHASYLINKQAIHSIVQKERKINLLMDYNVKYSDTYKHIIQQFL